MEFPFFISAKAVYLLLLLPPAKAWRQPIRGQGMKILDAKQEAKLNMYQVVQSHSDGNNRIVITNAGYLSAFNDFKAKVAQIVAATKLTSTVLTGITADKSVSKQELSQIGSRIAGFIFAYAAKTGNNTLKQAVDFSASDILRQRDAEIAPLCKNIHDLGVANLAELADYGVTTANLAALQTAIDSYTGQIPKPRAAVSERATAKANIKQYFKEADAILNEQMDKLAVNFKTANPDFVSEYTSNRIIIDPATTTTQLKGTVTTQTDGKPVKGATVTAESIGTFGPTISRSATTDPAGKYNIKPIPPGDYTITVTATGLTNFEADPIHAKLGTNNHLDVEMEQ